MALRDDPDGIDSSDETSAPEKSSAGRTVQSIERAFALLEAIARSDEPLGLAELSRSTGLHTSTAFHLIRTLVVLGYVRQEASRRYCIGPRLFMQAAGAFNETTLVNFATPHLRRLADESGETAHLAVRVDSGIAVIAKGEATSSVRTSDRLGTIRPAHCTAIGKVLLANLPSAELDGVLSGLDLRACTPATITDRDALRRELRQVAANGVALDDAEFNVELRCLAAPVRNFTGRVVAAVGISGPVWRVTPDEVPRLSAIVSAAARALSADLGARGEACGASD